MELANDRNHDKAIEHWKAVLDSLPSLVTTSYVLDEVVTFFNSRGHHDKAVQVGDNLLRSPSVQFIHIDEKLFFEGWRYFREHRDKVISVKEHTSLLVLLPSFCVAMTVT